MKEKIINFIKTPIIMSILIFILGAILFTNPQNVVRIVTYGFGSILIFLGFIRFINYLGDKKQEKEKNNDLIYSIVAIVIGLIIILSTSMIELILRIVMGSLILYNGIIRLVVALKQKETMPTMWKGNLFIAVIILSVGLYVVLKSNLVFSSIGLFMMIYSALEIVLYIINSKNDKLIIKK